MQPVIIGKEDGFRDNTTILRLDNIEGRIQEQIHHTVRDRKIINVGYYRAVARTRPPVKVAQRRDQPGTSRFWLYGTARVRRIGSGRSSGRSLALAGGKNKEKGQ